MVRLEWGLHLEKKATESSRPVHRTIYWKFPLRAHHITTSLEKTSHLRDDRDFTFRPAISPVFHLHLHCRDQRFLHLPNYKVSRMEAVAKQSCQPYQVFINHRGEDTKKNIASLIYHALEPYGLSVFLDQYVLSPGDTIETEIRRAISSSSVHIAIFSKNYAESRWCLNELLWMLKSSHGPKFIPIFCDVEPVELRFIKKGCYAKAFQKHLARESKELVDEWAKILGKAADISGKVFKRKKALGEAAGNSDTVFNWKESDYGKLVKNIENIVIEHVKRDPLELPPSPVGLEQAWKDLHDQIKEQSSKKVVVIAGLGGKGKSTLARHTFNELSRSEFRRAAYLFNVRERDDHDLQRQLWRHLLGKNMLDSWGGKTMLGNSLKGLKVLIVFDDVDKWDKIERVLNVHAVEEGSLIFVTSRDKDVVRASYKNTSFVYDVQPLKNKDGRELFCYHATRQSNSLEGCADLVEEFLKICGGLPLCLQVLGEQLSSNSDRTYWERQLKLYSQGASLPEADDIINKLKWSCEDMDIEQRRMLLDVAYFLVEEDKELAVQVLEGLDYTKGVHYYLRRLCETYLISFKNDVDYHDDDCKMWEAYSAREEWQLSALDPSQSSRYPARKEWQLPAWDPLQSSRWRLVTQYPARELLSRYSAREALQSLSATLTKRSSKIIMHNQIREMARCIVREDQSGPLRLSCAVDFEKQSGLLSREVRGICIRKDQSPSQLPVDINITGVRLLLVEHPVHDLSKFLASISGDLVWLRWRNSPCISLPRKISVKNLRVLELQGLQDHLENFFSSNDEIPLDLRVLHMDCTGHASSSTSSGAQPVDLQHSKKSFDGSSFSRFLRSIGTLMQNLTQIVLNINSESLPFDFSELKTLRHLDLSGSSNLTALPNSFSQLLQLQHLALRNCMKLSIPVDILGEISTLEHIDFKGCVQLVHLPQGIASQRRLRYLNLLETSLEELPLTLEPPYELEQLIIGSNIFRELSCSVAFLGKLKELFLVGCFGLEHIWLKIEQLTCLERLEIYGSKLCILPAGISLLKHLKVLTIISCPIEKFSLDNNVMDALTDLTLTHTDISDLSIPAGACPGLEIVDLSHNRRLREVEVSQSTIVKLNLEGCQNLQHMNLPKLGRLKFLNIKRCGSGGIQNVAECGSLEEIRAEECCFTIEAARSQLELPAWSQLQRLNFFTFSEGFDDFSWRRWKHLENTWRIEVEFEKFRNSFHGVTLRGVPDTANYKTPLLLENVHSHSAILMCFITYRDDFAVRFEACNGGAGSEEFVIRHHHDGAWVHVYMWTQRSTLFTDEDNFYDNVSIYHVSENHVLDVEDEEGVLDVLGSEMGWILTFSSENHVLHLLDQIIKPSAKVE